MTKRGKEFWNEFEYYLSDLTVGLVLDVLLVGLMATPAVIGKHHAAHNATGKVFRHDDLKMLNSDHQAFPVAGSSRQSG